MTSTGANMSNINSKATKILGFLRRNLTLAPMETKVLAYKTGDLGVNTDKNCELYTFALPTVSVMILVIFQ